MELNDYTEKGTTKPTPRPGNIENVLDFLERHAEPRHTWLAESVFRNCSATKLEDLLRAAPARGLCTCISELLTERIVTRTEITAEANIQARADGGMTSAQYEHMSKKRKTAYTSS